MRDTRIYHSETLSPKSCHTIFITPCLRYPNFFSFSLPKVVDATFIP